MSSEMQHFIGNLKIKPIFYGVDNAKKPFTDRPSPNWKPPRDKKNVTKLNLL